MEFVVFKLGPLQTNSILAWDKASKEGIVVDPTDDIEQINKEIEAKQVKIKQIYLTHGHFDHVDLTGTLGKKLGVETSLHQADMALYKRSRQLMGILGLQGGMGDVPDVKTHQPGDIIQLGKSVGRIVHTPGHSPGSCSIIFEGTVLSGDTLFAGNYGRTDLPGGNVDELRNSITEVLFKLPDNTRVLSGILLIILYFAFMCVPTGHAEETTIGIEKARFAL
ncbi:MAG: putative MBL fold metallo-hydrolase [Streblomastix strix]|uniref:Putative MBL fold metallo-hydrolase n=1 Tax=Streblomastix strix TaxID=222440 RepID=A0A5J4VNU2_9EUKA|nr:MAG: putative MBL fold metallo-hydrolase [Streblomastix strix]